MEALARACGAARGAAALFDEGARGKLRVSGRDRLKYLNNMTTQDLKDLAPGEGALACALTVKAKVIADMRVHALEEEVLLDVPEGRAAPLAEHLRKFVVVNQVKIEDASAALGAVAIEGPRAAEVIEKALGKPLLELKPLGAARFGDGFLTRASVSGENGYRLVVPRDAVRDLGLALANAGAEPIPAEAVEWLRIEAGTPAFGKDLDETTLPPEAGLEKTHVSYTKGCYLGQEPIARIHFLGHVNRKLMGLVFEGAEPAPPHGTPLFAADGKEVGRVTSPGFSPALGRPVGLGYVRREANAPGTHLQAGAAGGRDVEVRALPLVEY